MLQKIKTAFIHLLLFPIALVLIFEEWGWIPLISFFNRLAQAITVWQKIEEAITKLSPKVSLFILLIPMLTLMPLKILGFYYMDLGYITRGMSIVIISKVCGTAFFARLFSLTKPNLLKLRWFALYYPRWINWKNSLLAYARSSWPWRLAHALRAKAVDAYYFFLKMTSTL